MQFWEGEVFKTSEFHIIYKKCFSYVTFSTARLKVYHWENRMPFHNPSHPRTSPPSFLVPRPATLCLWLPIQRQRSRLCQDQELEFLCPWRSASKIAIGGILNRCFFPETSSRSFSTCPTPARATIPPAAALTVDLSSGTEQWCSICCATCWSWYRYGYALYVYAVGVLAPVCAPGPM